MKQIECNWSQNGRWGIALVTEDDNLEIDRGRNVFPGTIVHVGTTAGLSTWKLMPVEGYYTLLGSDMEVLSGGTVAERSSLQGGHVRTYAVIGPVAIVRHWGYDRRGCDIYLYKDGVKTNVPSPVLLAMGLVAPDADPLPEPVVPEVNPAIAEALRKAGVV